MSSILPCSSILPGPPCPPPVMWSLGGGVSGHGGSGHRGLVGEGGSGWKGVQGGGGQGTFCSSCHILHYHIVLRPKGTSHNNGG